MQAVLDHLPRTSPGDPAPDADHVAVCPPVPTGAVWLWSGDVADELRRRGAYRFAAAVDACDVARRWDGPGPGDLADDALVALARRFAEFAPARDCHDPDGTPS